MKTYPLNQPLKRISQLTRIQFENEMLKKKWYVFDSTQITDRLTFLPDNTFKLIKPHTIAEGEWKYLNGDSFQIQFAHTSYEFHLVHLDANLLIFELQDTEEYLILVSHQALQTLGLTTLHQIEYYLKKLQIQVRTYTKEPSYRQEFTNSIHPILIMGCLYGLHFGYHSKNDDLQNDEEINKRSINEEEVDSVTADIMDDEAYSDQEILNDLYDEEPEIPIEDVVTFNDSYEDSHDNEYNDGTEDYNQYGDFSDEEIIYDYLQSQEEDQP